MVRAWQFSVYRKHTAVAGLGPLVAPRNARRIALPQTKFPARLPSSFHGADCLHIPPPKLHAPASATAGPGRNATATATVGAIGDAGVSALDLAYDDDDVVDDAGAEMDFERAAASAVPADETEAQAEARAGRAKAAREARERERGRYEWLQS